MHNSYYLRYCLIKKYFLKKISTFFSVLYNKKILISENIFQIQQEKEKKKKSLFEKHKMFLGILVCPHSLHSFLPQTPWQWPLLPPMPAVASTTTSPQCHHHYHHQCHKAVTTTIGNASAVAVVTTIASTTTIVFIWNINEFLYNQVSKKYLGYF